MKKSRPRLGRSVLALGGLLGLVGCAPAGQDARDVVQDSLAQAAGATEAATLVMTLTGNGDLPVSAAATALDDTLTATLDAATSLATLDVANLREADLREAALGAVQATTSAIVASASALAEVRP